MTLGVDDIARIAFEATRIGLKSSLMPWDRLSETVKENELKEAKNRLNDPKYGEDCPEGCMMAAITQQLRNYM